MILTRFPDRLETVCGPCAGRVVWAVTVNGKRLPLDPEPNEAGNQAVWRDVHGTVRTRQLRDGETPDGHERRMMPHFPECARRQDEAKARAAAATPPGVVSLAAYRRRRKAADPGRWGRR